MNTEHSCKSCERDNSIIPASKWCSECEEGLCDECNNCHRKLKNTRHHHVVDVSEAENVSKIKILTCVKHKKMKQDFFCVDHDTMCCRQCMAEEHRSCVKVMAVELASQNVVSSSLVLNTLEDLDKIVSAFRSLSTKADGEVVFSERRRLAILDTIEKKRASLHREVDEIANNTVAQLEQHYTKIQLSLSDQSNTISDLVEKFENDKKSLQEAVDHGSAQQVFILAQNLKTHVIEGNRLVCNTWLKTEEISFSKVKTTSISFGEICHSVKTFRADIRSSEPQVMVEKANYDNRSLHYKGNLNMPHGHACIQGIALTVDGRLLLCCWNTNRVLCFENTDGFKTACDVKGRPFNICVIEEKKEAVCTLPFEDKLGVIDIDKFVLKDTVNLYNRGNPWGICVTSTQLVVGLYSNKVILFSKQYEFLETIELDYRDTTAACYIQAFPNEVFYLSNHNLHATDWGGKSKFHIEGKEDGRANGISTDPSENIYVAFENSKISRLSKDGHVINENILNRKCGSLWDIAFKNDYTQMYVVTEGGKSVSVFDFK